ncbi:MAG: three-Cys-motif partner protein TcmP [Synergistaceae bacterium]|nr:three-Cys-motif partner protein TcmP [Synergistaceae bacterium]
MSSSDGIIGHANPHTVKKFELIEKYVEAWAHKLLQNQYCSILVFIDCMSNSGEYFDNDGKQVFGTPVRVANYLKKVAGQYPHKQIDLFFSDLCAAKTDHLKNLMPHDSRNFNVHITTEDGNELAKRLGQTMSNNTHCLLVYDPYEAAIDWTAIMPFINNWSEVILNHMVSDSIRALKIVKKDEARSKYEHTYLMNLEKLIPYGSDKKAYEKRIEDIIKALRRNNGCQYYIAAFPFFNEKNAIVYNLIHCTSNIEGFKLYKRSAWQTFGGKSSTKNTHGLENQLMLDFDGKGGAKTHADDSCFYIKDIAEYLQKSFNGETNVPLNDV